MLIDKGIEYIFSFMFNQLVVKIVCTISTQNAFQTSHKNAIIIHISITHS